MVSGFLYCCFRSLRFFALLYHVSRFESAVGVAITILHIDLSVNLSVVHRNYRLEIRGTQRNYCLSGTDSGNLLTIYHWFASGIFVN